MPPKKKSKRNISGLLIQKTIPVIDASHEDVVPSNSSSR